MLGDCVGGKSSYIPCEIPLLPQDTKQSSPARSSRIWSKAHLRVLRNSALALPLRHHVERSEFMAHPLH